MTHDAGSGSAEGPQPGLASQGRMMPGAGHHKALSQAWHHRDARRLTWAAADACAELVSNDTTAAPRRVQAASTSSDPRRSSLLGRGLLLALLLGGLGRRGLLALLRHCAESGLERFRWKLHAAGALVASTLHLAMRKCMSTRGDRGVGASQRGSRGKGSPEGPQPGLASQGRMMRGAGHHKALSQAWHHRDARRLTWAAADACAELVSNDTTAAPRRVQAASTSSDPRRSSLLGRGLLLALLLGGLGRRGLLALLRHCAESGLERFRWKLHAAGALVASTLHLAMRKCMSTRGDRGVGASQRGSRGKGSPEGPQPGLASQGRMMRGGGPHLNQLHATKS